MILKFRENDDSWRLIDNIFDITHYPVKEGEFFDGAKCAVNYSRRIPYSTDTETLTRPFKDEAYILNDNGKTIERLVL